MRIFHFMNVPFRIDELKSGGERINTAGGWLTTLIGRMLTDTDFKIACAAFGKTNKVQMSHDYHIDGFIIPKGRWENNASIMTALSICRDLVADWKPDLIHIHGTEQTYGLLTARGMVTCPAVISLQGLLEPCSEWYHYFGKHSLRDVVRMHRLLEIPAMRGQWMGYLQSRRNAKREREIILGNRFFMGRTKWDHAHIRAHNPSAHYFHGGELIRDAFWQKRWDLGRARQYRIIFTNAGHPRKGTEILLAAVKLLRSNFPDIQIALAGAISRRSGYGRYMRRKIRELDVAAIELGQLNAEEMAKELANSHVFVSPSFIDNSPNAVCEAQLIGMPVISTYTGGLPSLIEDGRTGLFVPAGDVPILATRIREIFEDDALAVRLGNQAHEVAIKRHDPDVIIHGVLAAYEHILGKAT